MPWPSDKLHQVGAPEQKDSENDSVIEDCGEDGSKLAIEFLGDGWENWGGCNYLDLGLAKNDGYRRAGRGVVSTGGRSMYGMCGRINNSPVEYVSRSY
jgi:hypothetical protein